MDDDRRDGLLSWQWQLYPAGHADRWNLVLHVLSAPLFVLGTVALLAAPFAGARFAWFGLALPIALLMQALGHRRERTPPVPFRGPGDAALRLVVEQWITFPRYVASGLFFRALRTSSSIGSPSTRTTTR
jgi:hypothetical protein